MFEKQLKYVGNDLDLCKMAQICLEMTSLFDKRLKNVENDLVIWAQLKYLRNGFTMWEMAKEFDKRLKYVGNDVYLWEMA